MENANDLERRRSDDRLYHHSSILGCFLISLGACFAFLPNLPSDKGHTSNIKEITYSVLNVVYSAIAICTQLIALYFVRKRGHFHKSQLVLWPKRCRECARVLGMISSNIHSTEDCHVDQEQSSATSPVTTTRTLSSSINENGDTECFGSQPTSATPEETVLSRPLVNDEPDSCTNHNFNSTDANIGDCTIDLVGLNLHSCLKNAFLFYSLLSLPGILFLLVGQIFCLVQEKFRILSLSLKEVADLSLLTFVPVSMKFFLNYYDAVFVSTACNNVSLGMFISVGIWICVYQIKSPIAELMESPYSRVGLSCDLNGTLGNFIDESQKFMTPVYTQYLIIAVVILWQICASLTPRASLPPSYGQHHFETRQSQSVRSWLQSVVHHSKMFVRYVFQPRRLMKEDWGVYPRIGGTSGLHEYVYKTWALSVVMSGSNLILTFVIKSVSHRYTDLGLHNTYVTQCVDMALNFPLMLILVHERCMAMKQQPREFHLKPISNAYLEGHDVLLLLCSCGLFCLCIFRVSASIGLLYSHEYVDKYGIASPTYAIIYSLYSIVAIWLTTAFLLRVQRQVTKSITEIKLVLAGLIYIMTININEMIFFVFVNHEGNVETDFFCLKTVKVMTVLFTPFTILFFLCQAIIAFESYRVILKEVLAK